MNVSPAQADVRNSLIVQKGRGEASCALCFLMAPQSFFTRLTEQVPHMVNMVASEEHTKRMGSEGFGSSNTSLRLAHSTQEHKRFTDPHAT